MRYSSGVPGTCLDPGPIGSNDDFNLAAGDFNGDGYDDLAIGQPRIGDGTYEQTGFVQVYFGSLVGLVGEGYEQFTQDSAGIPGFSGVDHQFGASVSAGDINGDGMDDLVIGTPGDTVHGVQQAGSVLVMVGSPDGLQRHGSVRLHQATPGLPGRPARFGSFGTAVTVADVTGDGFADVAAVSRPRTGYSLLVLLRGARTGIGVAGLSSIGLRSLDENYIQVLSAGDVNGDGFPDLIGADPQVSPGGWVVQMLGSRTGVSSARSRSFNQDSPGIPGVAQVGDWFGATVAVGDLTGDGYDDVLVGDPWKTLRGKYYAGNIVLLRGSAGGISGRGAESWSEFSPGSCSPAEPWEEYGLSIVMGHFISADRLDARIAAPDENPDEATGLIQTMNGAPNPHLGACRVGTVGEGLGLPLLDPGMGGLGG